MSYSIAYQLHHQPLLNYFKVPITPKNRVLNETPPKDERRENLLSLLYKNVYDPMVLRNRVRRSNRGVKQTTQIMRQNRKDDEYRFKEAAKKILERVKKGAIPSGASLRKYYPHVTLEKINAIRAEKGWSEINIEMPPIVQPTPMNVIQQQINEETEKKLAEIARQERIRIIQDNDELRKRQEQLRAENEGRIVQVDQKDIFAIRTIIEYFKKNRGFVKGKPRKDATLERYFGLRKKKGETEFTWSGKSGNFYNFFEKWNQGGCLEDVSKCFERIDEALEWLENDKNHGWNTFGSKIAVLTPLLVIAKEYPAFKKLPFMTDVITKLTNKYDEFSMKEKTETTKRQMTEKITNFETIREAIYDTFQRKLDEPEPVGKISKEWLYFQMYAEMPSRDDMGGVFIEYTDVDDKPDSSYLKQLNDGHNILFIPPDQRKPVKFALINYKTKGYFKDVIKTFSPQLSKDIRMYVDDLPLREKYIFGANRKMSIWVGNMLVKAGIKKRKNDPNFDPNENRGSINILRKSYVTKVMKQIKADSSISAQEREDLAFAMKHAPETSLKYVREEIVPIAKEIKDELKKVTYDENQ